MSSSVTAAKRRQSRRRSSVAPSPWKAATYAKRAALAAHDLQRSRRESHALPNYKKEFKKKDFLHWSSILAQVQHLNGEPLNQHERKLYRTALQNLCDDNVLEHATNKGHYRFVDRISKRLTDADHALTAEDKLDPNVIGRIIERENNREGASSVREPTPALASPSKRRTSLGARFAPHHDDDDSDDDDDGDRGRRPPQKRARISLPAVTARPRASLARGAARKSLSAVGSSKRITKAQLEAQNADLRAELERFRLQLQAAPPPSSVNQDEALTPDQDQHQEQDYDQDMEDAVERPVTPAADPPSSPRSTPVRPSALLRSRTASTHALLPTQQSASSFVFGSNAPSVFGQGLVVQPSLAQSTSSQGVARPYMSPPTTVSDGLPSDREGDVIMQESNGSKEIDSQASLALQERLREANEKADEHQRAVDAIRADRDNIVQEKQGQIDSLQVDLDALRSELQTAQSDLSALGDLRQADTQQISQLVETRIQLEARIAELEQTEVRLDAEKAELETQYSDAMNERDTAQAQVTALEGQIDVLRLEFKTVQQDLIIRNSEHEAGVQRIDELSERTSQDQNVIQVLEQRQTQLVEEATLLEAARVAAADQRDRNQEQITLLQDQVLRLEATQTALNELRVADALLIAQSQGAQETLQARVAFLEQREAQLQQDKSGLEAERDSALASLDAEQHRLAALTAQYHSLEADLALAKDETVARTTEMQMELDVAHRQTQDAQLRAADLEGQLGASRAAHIQLGESIRRYQADLVVKDAAFAKQNVKVLQARKELEDSHAKIAEMERRFGNFMANFGALGESAAALSEVFKQGSHDGAQKEVNLA